MHLRVECLEMKLVINKSVTEEELIKGCLNLDPNAQKQLYEKYSAKMFGVCLRYVKDYSEAEDVLVTAFMKVFDRLAQYKGQGSLEGWIRRVTINEALTFLRKNRYMYLEVEIEKVDREPEFQKLENELEVEDLLNMVKRLPEGYRTVFNLYAIEGYTHREIAKKLEINVNTSKSQLSRARKLLQKYLVESEMYYNEKTVSNEKTSN